MTNVIRCARTSAAVLIAIVITVIGGCSADAGDVQDMDSMDMSGGAVAEPAGAADGGADDMAGMDMSGASSDGSVRLTPVQVSTFGITFGMAETRPLSRVIRAVGVVEFDETRMQSVAPKFGGWAEALHVDFGGESVQRGDPLLEVYSPELVAAQEELLLAARMRSSVGESRVQSVTRDADELLESARRRLEYWDISAQQIERLLETGEVRRTLTLYSPISGVVMEKNVIAGAAFPAGRTLYMIAGLSPVWVNAEVFEADAGVMKPGMAADVSVAAFPGRTYQGRVEFVYPTVGERTRSLRARISLPNSDGALKPGMYGRVEIEARLGDALTIPRTAVLRTGERDVVFVDMGDGALMPHEVLLGVQGGDYVSVLRGIAVGQRVVTSAQFLLDSESNLAEVMKAMMAQMGSSDGGGN